MYRFPHENRLLRSSSGSPPRPHPSELRGAPSLSVLTDQAKASIDTMARPHGIMLSFTICAMVAAVDTAALA